MSEQPQDQGLVEVAAVDGTVVNDLPDGEPEDDGHGDVEYVDPTEFPEGDEADVPEDGDDAAVPEDDGTE